MSDEENILKTPVPDKHSQKQENAEDNFSALIVDHTFSPLSVDNSSTLKAHRVEFIEPERAEFFFSNGMEVEANFGGLGEWYSAVIRGEKDDGTFDVEYDYGDIETHVTSDRLRVPTENKKFSLLGGAGETDLSARSSFSNITRVSLLAGISNPIVAQINNDYDTVVSLDELGSLGESSQIVLSPRGDTVIEPVVPILNKLVPTLPLGGDVAVAVMSTDSIESISLSPLTAVVPLVANFHLEDRVEADYFGRGKWYRGTIKKVRESPKEVSYDIHYDDGEIEVRVEESRIKVLVVDVGAQAGPFLAIPVGHNDSVSNQVPQIVDLRMANAAATVNIASKLASKQQSKAGGADPAVLSQGDLVEANYRNLGKWYPGEVRRVREEANEAGEKEYSYDVGYDDGEIEVRVEMGNIRKVPQIVSNEEEKSSKLVDVEDKKSEGDDKNEKSEENIQQENNQSVQELPIRSVESMDNGTQLREDNRESTQKSSPQSASINLSQQPPEPVDAASVVQMALAEAVKSVSRSQTPSGSRPVSAMPCKSEESPAVHDKKVAIEGHEATEAEAEIVEKTNEKDETGDAKDEVVEEAKGSIEPKPVHSHSEKESVNNAAFIGDNGSRLETDNNASRDDGLSIKHTSNAENQTQALLDVQEVAQEVTDQATKKVTDIMDGIATPKESPMPASKEEPIQAADHVVRDAVQSMLQSATENASRHNSRPSSAVASSVSKDLHMANAAATVNIASKLASKQQSKSGGADPAVLSQGDRVEANYRNLGKWYPGEVRRVREEANEAGEKEYSYDVGYDDGEIEVRVEMGNIRKVPQIVSNEDLKKQEVVEIVPSNIKMDVVDCSVSQCENENDHSEGTSSDEFVRASQRETEKDGHKGEITTNQSSKSAPISLSQQPPEPVDAASVVQMALSEAVKNVSRSQTPSGSRPASAMPSKSEESPAVHDKKDEREGHEATEAKAEMVEKTKEKEKTGDAKDEVVEEKEHVAEMELISETAKQSMTTIDEPKLNTIDSKEEPNQAADHVVRDAVQSMLQSATENASRHNSRPSSAVASSVSKDLHMANAAATVNIASKLASKQQSKSGGADTAVLSQGDRVEANYRNLGKWYPGEVRRVREEASESGEKEYSYDVGYDDGEIEVRVEMGNIRKVPQIVSNEDLKKQEVVEIVPSHVKTDIVDCSARQCENGNDHSDGTSSDEFVRASKTETKKDGHKGEITTNQSSKSASISLSQQPPEPVDAASVVQMALAEAVKSVSRSQTPSGSRPASAMPCKSEEMPAVHDKKDEQGGHEAPEAKAEIAEKTNEKGETDDVATKDEVVKEKEHVAKMEPISETVKQSMTTNDEPKLNTIDSKEEPQQAADHVVRDAVQSMLQSATENVSRQNSRPSSAVASSVSKDLHMANAAATVNIASKLVSKQQSKSGGADTAVLSQGDRVEANYRNLGKWYPGEVRRVREEASESGEKEYSYDVGYDDGEIEVRVEMGNVRVIPTVLESTKESVSDELVDREVAPSVDIKTINSQDSIHDETKKDDEEEVISNHEQENHNNNAVESKDQGVEIFIRHTLEDAVDDVSHHSHKHLDEASSGSQFHSQPTEPEIAVVTDTCEEQVKISQPEEETKDGLPSEDAVTACDHEKEQDNTEKLSKLQEEQRVKAEDVFALDSFQYSGPAISQRKALRDLHAAHTEQKQQLAASLQRVSSMKASLQNRQLNLNNSTKKAKNLIFDLQEHLAAYKKSPNTATEAEVVE